MSLIKYRYADSSGTVIDIESVGENRNRDFTCLSCHNTLVPVLGQKRQKHFRHKADVECSKETYLHNLAKRVFCETYQQCLADGSSFIIEYHSPRICSHCTHYGPCTIEPALYKADLTKIFKKVMLESRVGNFIPDVLLVSDKDDKLFVEIAVTHFSEESKTGAGFRMVEIAIDSEEDIGLIRRKVLSVLDTRITMMNFRVKPYKGDLYRECSREISYFRLHKSGKSIIVGPSPMWQYDELLRSGECVEKVDYPGPDIYAEMVRKHFKAGQHIRNCLLCQFHCIGYRTGTSFCKLAKKGIDNLNYASDCQKYRVKPPDELATTLPRYPRSVNQLAALGHIEASIQNHLSEEAGRGSSEASASISSPEYVVMKLYGQQLSCVFCRQTITFFTKITFESKRLPIFTYNIYDESLSFYRLSALKRILPKEFDEDLNIGRLAKGKCRLCEKKIISVLCPCCSTIQCEKAVIREKKGEPEDIVIHTRAICVSGGKLGLLNLLNGKTLPDR